MTTLLVTGGAGFLGSCFVRHILNKYSNYKGKRINKNYFKKFLYNCAS